MKIVVIGAGVVGLASAWYLQRDGHEVTVVDRAASVGMGTSHANGGQLSYRYIAPLADPDILGKIPGWLLQSGGPIRFRPRFDPDQWRWLAAFMQACTSNAKLRSVASLLPLSLYSRSLVHELIAEHGLEFDFVRNGKLVLYRDPASYASARRLLDSTPELASEQSALDPDACLALEPSLERLRGKIHGGIHTRSEDAGDCHKLCLALAAKMASGPNPVRLELGQAITQLERHNGRITAVHTVVQRLDTDACVVAAGSASTRLLGDIGVRVPVYPLKGYSISMPLTPEANAPTLNVTDYERKIVYARLGTRLRVAGMADIVGNDERIVARRIKVLIDEARATFGAWLDHADITPWTGLRPATPSGRPIVDNVGADNLWLNIGHGALGFTLATGCARVLADRLAGRQPAIPHADFLLSAA
ncbi:MAG: D-amino acid dehydrogenase [Rhodocyclales bacterium]|nr:D-amino acid dehydrogenase [Rhodocyclales bacterium]